MITHAECNLFIPHKIQMQTESVQNYNYVPLVQSENLDSTTFNCHSTLIIFKKNGTKIFRKKTSKYSIVKNHNL